MPKTMKAAVFVEPGRIELAERPIPDIGPTDALLRVSKANIRFERVSWSATSALGSSKTWARRLPVIARVIA